ncbi:EamA family transporter RarD [Macrococcus carouselicus]|uniref:EamA family transporter RarD n=1 Tax=Macrococcus carouselicus TaxID=69969 RepID=A0A9Q8FP28_9STAP|nr:EamA family transporter RarD [Macrococcus carouselicus]TDL96611.1 EamA family transporter RarD [Macrococcus carouselicus]
MSEQQKGILYAAGSYVIWGVLPLYWKFIDDINPYEILAHRIIWSLVFMILLVIFLRKTNELIVQTKRLFSEPKQAISLFVAALVITVNWGLFIWAVSEGHIMQASLGYYINPLMSILLGLFFMKERFTKVEWTAIALAAAGVFFMTISLGVFPYISVMLATSFAIYGLLKKNVRIDAIYTILLECLFTLPFALIGLVYLKSMDMSNYGMNQDSFLLLFSGALTAIPLILFTAGARRIPLSLIGFLQYIGPTLMLIQSVFLFHEKFTTTHLVTFGLIWTGLILYSVSKIMAYRKHRFL